MYRIEFIYFDLGNVLISFDHSRAWQQIAGLTGISSEHVEKILLDSGLQIEYEKGEVSTKEFHSYFASKLRSVFLLGICVLRQVISSIHLMTRFNCYKH